MQDDSKWKLILAVVRPHLVEALLDCLKLAPIESLLIKNMLDRYSGSDFELAFLPKVELSIWVDALRLEEVLELLEEAGRTGRMGDGKIMVIPAAAPLGLL